MVQRLAIRMVAGFCLVHYEERLTHAKIFFIQGHHQRGDLISTFRIVNGFDKVKWHLLRLHAVQ